MLSTQDEDGCEQLTPLCHPRIPVANAPGNATNTYPARWNKDTIDARIHDDSICGQDIVGGQRFWRRCCVRRVYATHHGHCQLVAPPLQRVEGGYQLSRASLSSPIKYVSRSHSRNSSSEYSLAGSLESSPPRRQSPSHLRQVTT